MSWAGLVVIAMVSRRSGGVFENALTDGLGLGPSDPRTAKWSQAVFPFLLHDRRVERTKNLEYGPARQAQPARHLPATRRPPAAAPRRRSSSRSTAARWVIGDKSQQGLPLMLQLAAEGWVCVAINYRLSPKATWPEHLIDCKRALAWVREHIAEYGGDPDLICVTGGSAGGHLAAMVGLTANEARYQPEFEAADTSVAACIPFYGVYDFVSMFAGDRAKDRAARLLARWVMKATPEEDPAAFADASPVAPRPRRCAAVLRHPRHP